jgi:hypothetical protein
MFNTWINDPEAFQPEYEEYQELLRQLAQEKADHEAELLSEGRKEVQFDDDCDEQPEGDLFDIVRQYEEAEDNMSDVEADADTLASAGYGTDEDYGDYGQCQWGDD